MGATKQESRRIGRDGALNRLDMLTDFILVNGKPGSRIVDMFRKLKEQWNRDDGPTWGICHMAAEAWREVGREEQRRILNGWHPHNDQPAAAMALAWIEEASVEAVLRIDCMSAGEVHLSPEFVPSDGITSPVTLLVKEGTDAPTFFAALHVITAALQAHWQGAIGLRQGECLTVPAPDAGAAWEPVKQALDGISRAMAEVKALLHGHKNVNESGCAADDSASAAEVFAASVAKDRLWRNFLRRQNSENRQNSESAKKHARKRGGKARKSKAASA